MRPDIKDILHRAVIHGEKGQRYYNNRWFVIDSFLAAALEIHPAQATNVMSLTARSEDVNGSMKEAATKGNGGSYLPRRPEARGGSSISRDPFRNHGLDTLLSSEGRPRSRRCTNCMHAQTRVSALKPLLCKYLWLSHFFLSSVTNNINQVKVNAPVAKPRI